MLSYYAEDFSENASRGVINEISDVKLLQGDLAESWREDGKEYASVAMRYSLRDRFVDRTTGRASDGNDQSQEATEVWTFTRVAGRQLAALGDPADAVALLEHEHEKPGSDAGLFVWRVANACSVLVADHDTGRTGYARG